jgi:hypothetical protein
MTRIVYDTEKKYIFTLIYELHKYIPNTIFEEYEEHPELHFIQKLFANDSNIQFIGEFPMIWSTHYIYKFMNKEFTLVLDEDYDSIHYAIENQEDRNEIAEYICKLIEKQKCSK